MTLIENATQVWHRLWSLRFAALAFVFGVAEQTLPLISYLQGVVPAKVFAMLSLVCVVLSFVSRLVKQPTLAK